VDVGRPQNRTFHIQTPSPSQNNAFPSQILVYMEEFFMDLEKRALEEWKSAELRTLKFEFAVQSCKNAP